MWQIFASLVAHHQALVLVPWLSLLSSDALFWWPQLQIAYVAVVRALHIDKPAAVEDEWHVVTARE